VFDAVGLAELARKAAGTDVSFADDAELLAAAVELESARAALDAAAGHVLGELDARGVCDRDFGLSTVSWLAHHTHRSRPVIAGRVKTAAKLRRLGVVDDALADGVISAEHARVVVDAANPRIAPQITDLQPDLVELAQRCPFVAWRRHVTELAELLDQDGGYDPNTDLARNHLHVHPLGVDGIKLTGQLFGEHALSFTHQLETETDRLWRRHHNDADTTSDLPVPSRATLRALALVELLRHGTTRDPETTKAPTVDITLVIHTDHPDQVMTPDGTVVPRDTVEHLCCDPIIHPVTLDDAGLPLNVGRASRYATPTQRRALAIRDGGCVFPGCDTPHNWCDIHHTTPWDKGGLTNLAELASTCRHHHGVTHRKGWTMTANPDQTFTWTTPTGQTLHSQRNRGSPHP